MEKYISKSRLRELILMYYKRYTEDKNEERQLAMVEIGIAIDREIDAPVSRTVYGHWVKPEKLIAETTTRECSVCKHYWISAEDIYDYKYCPGCGANMTRRQQA